jgi:hypothetical protein
MSNLVLPTLPGRSAERTRTPLHKTHVAESVSGHEFRWRQATTPRWQYRQSYNFLHQGRFTTDELETLVGFYNAHGGRADSWLYNDPEDNTATAQPFGLGDGVTASFQLLRTLGGNAEPVAAVQGMPVVSVNGVALVNMLRNSDFETDVGADGLADEWGAYTTGTTGTVTRTLDATTAWGPGMSQRIACTGLGGTADDRAGVFQIRSANGKAGTAFTLSAYAHGSVGQKVALYAQLWKGGVAGQVVILSASTLTGVWQRFSASGVATQDFDQVYAYVWQQERPGGTGASVMNVDKAQLQVGASVTDWVGTHQPSVAAGTGVLVFEQAPAVAATLSWSGQYYWRCRFLQDSADFKRLMQGLWQLGAWDFVTVLPR